jgi:hypothetical protein
MTPSEDASVGALVRAILQSHAVRVGTRLSGTTPLCRPQECHLGQQLRIILVGFVHKKRLGRSS